MLHNGTSHGLALDGTRHCNFGPLINQHRGVAAACNLEWRCSWFKESALPLRPPPPLAFYMTVYTLQPRVKSSSDALFF